MRRNIHRVVASVSNCLFRITATGRLIVVRAWCSRWWTFQGYKYYTEVNNGKFFLPRIGHSKGIAERSQETLGNAEAIQSQRHELLLRPLMSTCYQSQLVPDIESFGSLLKARRRRSHQHPSQAAHQQGTVFKRAEPDSVSRPPSTPSIRNERHLNFLLYDSYNNGSLPESSSSSSGYNLCCCVATFSVPPKNGSRGSPANTQFPSGRPSCVCWS